MQPFGFGLLPPWWSEDFPTDGRFFTVYDPKNSHRIAGLQMPLVPEDAECQAAHRHTFGIRFTHGFRHSYLLANPDSFTDEEIHSGETITLQNMFKILEYKHVRPGVVSAHAMDHEGKNMTHYKFDEPDAYELVRGIIVVMCYGSEDVDCNEKCRVVAYCSPFIDPIPFHKDT